MELRNISDKNGVWFINTCQFALVEPTTKARFEPGVLTQALSTDWIKMQPVLKLWVDPDEPAKAVAVPVAAKAK